MRGSLYFFVLMPSGIRLDKIFALSLERSSPEFPVGCETGNERIHQIALREIKRAIIEKPFDLRIYPRPCFERRPLGGTVKIYIEIYLESANVLFEACDLLIDRYGLFMLRGKTTIKTVGWCHV